MALAYGFKSRLPHQFGVISLTGITPFYCAFCENAFVSKMKKRTIFPIECGKSAAIYFWTIKNTPPQPKPGKGGKEECPHEGSRQRTLPPHQHHTSLDYPPIGNAISSKIAGIKPLGVLLEALRMAYLSRFKRLFYCCPYNLSLPMTAHKISISASQDNPMMTIICASAPSLP